MGRKISSHTVEAFATALERYCREALAHTQKEHGKPTSFEVAWMDGPFWCRAFNLGWSAKIGGKYVTQDYNEQLDVDALDLDALKKIAGKFRADKTFFRDPDGTEALTQDGLHADTIPGEFGQWVMGVFDDVIATVSRKLEKDPALKRCGFELSGMIEPLSDRIGAIRDLRDAHGHAPSTALLDSVFALLSKDAATRKRWLALVPAMPTRSAATPRWKELKLTKPGAGSVKLWVTGTELEWYLTDDDDEFIPPRESEKLRSIDAVYASAEASIAKQFANYLPDSGAPAHLLALALAYAKHRRLTFQVVVELANGKTWDATAVTRTWADGDPSQRKFLRVVFPMAGFVESFHALFSPRNLGRVETREHELPVKGQKRQLGEFAAEVLAAHVPADTKPTTAVKRFVLKGPAVKTTEGTVVAIALRFSKR